MHRLCEYVLFLACLYDADRGIIEFAGSLQHTVLIIFDRLLQTRVLNTHVVPDQSAVKQVPGDCRTDTETGRARAATDRVVGPANRSKQGERRVEIRFSNSNLCRLRGGLPGCGANVRTAHQQAARNIVNHKGVHRWQGLWMQRKLRHVSRWPPQKRCKCVANLGQRDFQARNTRQGCQVLCLRLLQVEFRVLAAFKAPRGYLETAPLCRRVVLRDLNSQQRRLVCEVKIRNLCVQQNLQVTVVIDRGEERGIRRFDAALKPPPEIQFPSQVESRLVAPQALVTATG